MGLTREEKDSKQIDARSVEQNMRIVFSNLDALMRVDRRGTWLRKIKQVRDTWKETSRFDEYAQHIIDTCYEKVMKARGYGGASEVKKKVYR